MGPKLLIAFVVILQLAGNVVVCYNDEQDLPYWLQYVFEFGNPYEGTTAYTKEGEIQGGKLTINLPFGQLGVRVTYVRVEVTALRRPVVLYNKNNKQVTIEVDDLASYKILAKTEVIGPW